MEGGGVGLRRLKTRAKVLKQKVKITPFLFSLVWGDEMQKGNGRGMGGAIRKRWPTCRGRALLTG